MADESIRDIAEIALPFGRLAKVREVDFESGLRMVRLVLQEGRRITQIDLDEASAKALGDVLCRAADGPVNGAANGLADSRDDG